MMDGNFSAQIPISRVFQIDRLRDSSIAGIMVSLEFSGHRAERLCMRTPGEIGNSQDLIRGKEQLGVGLRPRLTRGPGGCDWGKRDQPCRRGRGFPALSIISLDCKRL